MTAAKPKDHKDNKEKPEDEKPWDQPEQQPSKPSEGEPPTPGKPTKPGDPATPPNPADVQPAAPPDPLQAVDCANQKINIGDAVYFVGIVQGFRADIDNRLNILIMPMYNVITNNDPSNPFIGAVDAKLLPMSGYHCVNTGPISNVADVFTPITDPLLTQLRELAQKAADTISTSLPSNFLVPSYA